MDTLGIFLETFKLLTTEQATSVAATMFKEIERLQREVTRLEDNNNPALHSLARERDGLEERVASLNNECNSLRADLDRADSRYTDEVQNISGLRETCLWLLGLESCPNPDNKIFLKIVNWGRATNKKIMAIKYWRYWSNKSLRDCKNDVDTEWERLGAL